MCGTPALAQEVTAPTTVEELFGKLVQLQEANLGVARQIAETQLRAADAIQVAIDEGGVTDPALVKLAQTFIDNGRTLASVVLAPIGTGRVAAGETMKRLLRANIAMFERSRGAARVNADLAAAFEKYAVLQTQSEDLLVALANGWDRYGEVVRTAELAGMIRPGSFDSVDASWRLVSPDAQVAAVAPEAEEKEEPVAPAPVPALTGNPRGPEEPQPEATAVESEPQAETPARETTGSTPSRLDATGPLALAEINADGSGKIGDWTIEADGTGLFIASSPNINPKTSDRIGSMTIACGENGMLYYQMAASADYSSYVVYSDDALSRSVSAEGNIIKNADASALADTLRLSFEWAGRDPDAKRRMTVAAVDDDEIPAQFSPSGYMEARGRVLDACVAGIVAKAMGTPDPNAAEPAPSPTVAAADLPPGATIKQGLVAPTPLVRPKSFKTPTGPVNIMGGT
ncbi:MAG TPA: hypothetical protein VIN06_17605 [Devosia sp.]